MANQNFNLKEYSKRQIANQEFKNTIDSINATLWFTKKQKYEYDETCSHDFVLELGKEGMCALDTGFATCLCCGKTFHIKADPEEVKKENILNIVGLVPDDYFYTICSGENILVTRAKEKLMVLANLDEELPIEMVKQIIVSDLKEFTTENKAARKDFLKRVLEQRKK